MEDLKLNENAFLPLRDVVFNTLREAILRGDLKPGERLMELALASKLGVSRTPIREAIRMLEQEGLAVTIPRRGAQVAGMTEKDMEDVLQIREALDILAAQIACEKMTDEELVDLRKAAERFKECTKADDVRKLAEADVEFHDVIYNATDNPKLINLLSNLREQLYRYRVEYLKDESKYKELIDEHEKIVQGFETKNMEILSGSMKEHVEGQASAMRKVIRDQV
ncbi:MAG: GntR family transcriptional regulator [Lachnospiraceae bacterium]|nr:GntR family transcriptional regulator [Lachnospiraceae bacterium]